MALDIELDSARIIQRFKKARDSGDERSARDCMIMWSHFRDTLSGEDRERCIHAAAAAITNASEEALALLKETDPLAYEVYVRVKQAQKSEEGL